MTGLIRWTAAICAMALAMGGCSGQGTEGARGAGGEGDALEFVDNPGRFFGPARPGVVWIYGEPIKAKDELVLRSATLHEAEAGNEHKATRVAYLGDVPGGYAQSLCAPEWPPPGFGPTVPIDGFQTRSGKWFVVYLFLQAQRLGSWAAEGIEFRYEDQNTTVRQVHDGLRWENEFTEDDTACPGGLDDPWFPQEASRETKDARSHNR